MVSVEGEIMSNKKTPLTIDEIIGDAIYMHESIPKAKSQLQSLVEELIFKITHCEDCDDKGSYKIYTSKSRNPETVYCSCNEQRERANKLMGELFK